MANGYTDPNLINLIAGQMEEMRYGKNTGINFPANVYRQSRNEKRLQEIKNALAGNQAAMGSDYRAYQDHLNAMQNYPQQMAEYNRRRAQLPMETRDYERQLGNIDATQRRVTSPELNATLLNVPGTSVPLRTGEVPRPPQAPQRPQQPNMPYFQTPDYQKMGVERQQQLSDTAAKQQFDLMMQQLRDVGRGGEGGDEFGVRGGVYKNRDGITMWTHDRSRGGVDVYTNMQTGEKRETPPQDPNLSYWTSASDAAQGADFLSRRNAFDVDREKEFLKARLKSEIATFEALSPLRISEDGIIQANRAQIEEDRFYREQAAAWEAAEAARVRLAQAEISSYEDAVSRFDGWADEAVEEVGLLTAGFFSPLMTAIPGSPAANLAESIRQMAAFVGFESLQAMRESSPTGGALGNVSDTELALLTAAFGSLAQRQSPARLRQRIREAQAAIQQIIDRKIKAGEPFENPWANYGSQRGAPPDGDIPDLSTFWN